jgi:uncharacterized membrane protein
MAEDDIRSRHRRLFGRGESTERLVFFSDAVFAIAMTLLVLDIRLPDLPADADVLPALGALWPKFFAYALSFVIIAINWTSHHRKFRVIVKYDDRLIWINMLLLLLIAFVPFPTSVLSYFTPQPAVVILYAATVAAISIVGAWLWAHAYRAGLMSPEVDAGMNRYVWRGFWPTPAVFIASIPIAVFQPVWAMFFWILIWPVSRVADNAGLGLGRLSRKPARRSPDSASEAEH